MPADWNALSDDAQVALAREALIRASKMLARHAEALAREMEAGHVGDRGGPDALRLFAAVIRISGEGEFVPAGRA
jgi:hypothetical protein